MSMGKKVFLRLRAVVVVALVCVGLCGTAWAQELIPGGETVGIQINVDGVLVAGTSEVETDTGLASPARDAGLRGGDVIVAVDGQPVHSAMELVEQMEQDCPVRVDLTVMRNGLEKEFLVDTATQSDGRRCLGLWLRDGVSGIGTVTYIDPETGRFGALGHGVNDMDSGVLLPLDSGSVCWAKIVDVKPGLAGSPGELAGSFSADQVLGRLDSNTASGIFGVMGQEFAADRSAVPVAEEQEIQAGAATILACVSGGGVKEYAVEIAKTGLTAADGRDLLVRVTDPELLSLTGGIVQGMSGSPILQNGKLVGAVTHVWVRP
jgi:stage IV sporulation protein B